MNDPEIISDAIRSASQAELSKDKYANRISSLDFQINALEGQLQFLKIERDQLIKERPPVIIKWRESIRWCLEIDSENYRYFLKSTSGVYQCIAFKHKVDITGDIKNKISVTLAALFKEKTIGRISYEGIYLYGLTKFFTDDLSDLKDEYKAGLNRLIIK
jgi:hypothetical protein